MSSKSRSKKQASREQEAPQQDEELLKHPVMMYPPITPVMVTAQQVPFYAEPDETSQVVGGARMKEVVPVLQSQGPWLMTVANFEEAWLQADWVAEVEQDSPDQYFKDQQVINDAFEERADQTEEGEPVKTETRSYLEMAEGYGMAVMPETTEELFVQAYGELIYAFEPNAELLGTYRHLMQVFSPDSLVELEDYITLPAEVNAGEKTGEGPMLPEQRERAQKSGETDVSAAQRAETANAPGAAGGNARQEPTSLGTMAEVNPVILALAEQSWGVNLADVEVVEDASLVAQGRRGAVSDGQTIRLAPGASRDIHVLLEELAHIVQHRNAASGAASEKAPRDEGALEAEAQQAVENAICVRPFEIVGVASRELHDDGAKDGEALAEASDGGADAPGASEYLVNRGIDEAEVSDFVAQDPDRLGAFSHAAKEFPTLTPAALALAMQSYRELSTSILVSSEISSPVLDVYIQAVGDFAISQPWLLLSWMMTDSSGISAYVSGTESTTWVYSYLGRESMLSTRQSALTLAHEGQVDLERLAEIDDLMLNEDPAAILADARQITSDLRDETEAVSVKLRKQIQGHTTSTTGTPSFEMMDEFQVLLSTLESTISKYQPLVRRLDAVATRWVLQAVANEAGIDFPSLHSKLYEEFQRALELLFESSAEYNRLEFKRQEALVQSSVPRPDQLRINPGNDPLDDRDWRPMHIPGLQVERMPLDGKGIKPSVRRVRTPDDVTSVVVHTGAKSNQDTVDTLNKKDLAGHFSIERDGSTIQMFPTGQSGAHAGAANSESIAVDLGFGDGYGDGSAQVAFLSSLEQMVATAKVVLAQDAISPDVRGAGTPTRGKLMGEWLASTNRYEGLYSNVVDESNSPDVAGVTAHEGLPDATHSDPGRLYMQRLHLLIPVLEAYEKRYGPLLLADDRELERVVRVLERYESETGKQLGPINEADLMQRVVKRLGVSSLEMLFIEADPETLDETIDDVFDTMVEELARSHLGANYEAEVASVIQDIESYAVPVDFKNSRAGLDLMRNELSLPRMKPAAIQQHMQNNPTDVKRVMASQVWKSEEADYRDKIYRSRANDIVAGRVYGEVMDASIGDLRTYLEAHLAELM